MIRIIFDTAYHAVLDVDNLIRLIGHAALVSYDDDGHARDCLLMEWKIRLWRLKT